MQAQTSSSGITDRRGAPATAGHAVTGLSPAYEAELNTWARSQNCGDMAVGRIKTWLAAADTSQVLYLSFLGLNSLPLLPEQLKKLSAARNNLHYLPENLPALEVLDVSHNFLAELPEGMPIATLRLLNVTCNTLETVPLFFNLLRPGCRIYVEGNAGLAISAPDGCFCDLEYLWALKAGVVTKVKAMLAAFPDAAVYDFRNQDTPLYIASVMGHVGIVELLLQHPDINVNRRGSTGDTPLVAALAAGREDIALLLLARADTDPDKPASAGGATALHFALAMKQYKAASSLLRRLDINPNLTDGKGWTALQYVTENGDLAGLQLLLGCPLVDIHKTSANDWPPIAQAAALGHLTMVETLLQKMTNNQTVFTRACSRALFEATAHGQTDIVALMLRKYRSDPDVCGHRSKIPPICLAAHYGHLDIVNLLLRFNANLNVRLPDGTPALIIGIVKGRMDIFKAMLFHQDVDPNLGDSAVGMSPLCFAAHTGAFEFLKLLLTHKKVDVNYADQTSSTPLLQAAHRGDGAILQCLLEDKRLMVNKVGSDGKTALIASCGLGNTAAVKLLLQHDKIDLYARPSPDGGSALQLAIATGRADIVRMLMHAMDGSEKAKIEAVDGLVAAIYMKSARMIELLVALGANPNQACTQRISPLEFFLEAYDKEWGNKLTGSILTCLFKAGARIDLVRTLESQKKLASAIGNHVIDVLTEATEPLKRKASGESFDLMKASDAQAMQHIEDAEVMLATIAKMSSTTQDMVLAAVALNSANAYDLVLNEHPQLEKLVNSVYENKELESSLKCKSIHMYMKVWDGSGIDAAGQGSFSVLQTERDRLPSGTRSILAAWKL